MKKYTTEEKICILREYFASGLSKSSFAKTFGLTGTSISQWQRQMNYSTQDSIQQVMEENGIPTDESDLLSELSRLKKEKNQLEKELQQTRWRLEASELIIDLAESTYHIAVRKNSDAK